MQENIERNKQIRKLNSQGYSYRQLAIMFKITHQRVHQIINVCICEDDNKLTQALCKVHGKQVAKSE